MSPHIKFIQQSIDKERQFFIGHYENLHELYARHQNVLQSMFPSMYRVKRVLENQGYISVLVEEFNLDYRIEVSE